MWVYEFDYKENQYTCYEFIKFITIMILYFLRTDKLQFLRNGKTICEQMWKHGVDATLALS